MDSVERSLDLTASPPLPAPTTTRSLLPRASRSRGRAHSRASGSSRSASTSGSTPGSRPQSRSGLRVGTVTYAGPLGSNVVEDITSLGTDQVGPRLVRMWKEGLKRRREDEDEHDRGDSAVDVPRKRAQTGTQEEASSDLPSHGAVETLSSPDNASTSVLNRSDSATGPIALTPAVSGIHHLPIPL
ncbi:hypothetical protein BV25DRAFT_1204691 [Artomyces pyxidatus]|uniref:Uncharacterized protein n=1 Tax=Artomyces pyxidatus TaxID=48021 RepID=A0ACB8SQD3_9AGAM|nr:hypothetical protein BV25DRAFT_1204691 [Artomyces pyxidatus]